MSLPFVVQRITSALDQAGIEYMLTGSFASAYYGSPRSTQDIDMVIAASDEQLETFAKFLPKNKYYLDFNAAIEARQKESMFNVIDMELGWKIDLIFRKSRAFSREEFGRRIRVNIEGAELYVASAEDVVIAKLEWAKLAQSLRQIEDAAGILKMRSDSLDRTYLRKWTGELGLTVQWNEAHRISQGQ